MNNIQEAIRLTGKSRRTIYDHCTSGRLSYTVGGDGRRYFETDELIRVYGELPDKPVPEITTDTMEVIAALATEVTMLRSEISRLCRLLTPDDLKAFDLVNPK